MAHEVTKRVGRRAYRYRVESYRDEATSKVRSRWTYLGVVAGDDAALAPARRSSAEETRERLLIAFEALAADLPYRDITASAVATSAGLAHGTFYRHFPDKRALLIAGIDRVRRELDRARPNFESPIGTMQEERARLREWVLALYAWPGLNPGLYRAFVDAHENDEELRALKRARIAERSASFAAYLARLAAAGVAAIEHPLPLASALIVLLNGSLREVFTSQASPGHERELENGIADAFDRAIFGVRG